jgi:DNA-binding response OmpR family regulator
VKHILIADDEPGIVLGLGDELKGEGFKVSSVGNGEEALAAVRKQKPSLLILDIMLPKLSGIEVCKRLRGEGLRLPILMLTAKGEEVDKIVGLEVGADDYVTKPFSLREVVARVKAILRRDEEAGTKKGLEKLEFGDLIVDFRKFEASKRGKRLDLSPREFRILKLFAERPREVIRREEILDKVWTESNVTDRSVDNEIFKIRKEIEADPGRPRYIVSIRSVGYKFVPEGESS